MRRRPVRHVNFPGPVFMSIAVECDNCGRRYNFRDEMAGRKGKCKICGAALQVPDFPEEGLQSQIIRHERRMREFEPALGDEESIERISDHIEEHIGPVETVFHELVSDMVHVDVHFVAASDTRPYHTLITSGMSDKPMTIPAGAEEWRHAELMISLPESWPMSQDAFKDETNYWPVRCLKFLARLPHEYETWLGYGHTVPNGDPPEPFAKNTKLCCNLLTQPFLPPEEFQRLTVNDDKVIYFYAVVPLYAEETNYKLKHGADALVERLRKHDVSEVLDPGRKNVCRRGFWPF